MDRMSELRAEIKADLLRAGITDPTEEQLAEMAIEAIGLDCDYSDFEEVEEIDEGGDWQDEWCWALAPPGHNDSPEFNSAIARNDRSQKGGAR